MAMPVRDVPPRTARNEWTHGMRPGLIVAALPGLAAPWTVAAKGNAAPAVALAVRWIAGSSATDCALSLAWPQNEASSDHLALLRPDPAIVAGFRKLQISHLFRVHFSGGAVRQHASLRSLFRRSATKLGEKLWLKGNI